VSADPVSSATVKRHSLLLLYSLKKTKNKALRVLGYVLDPVGALATFAYIFFSAFKRVAIF
jgi:hypothetical protein